jgi:thiol:disulfide interchange protein DsbD
MSKSYWAIIYLLVIVLVSNTLPITSISAHKGIQWQTYSSGMSLAHENGKKVFLHFYATWCTYCSLMYKESFQNDSIIELLNDKFISIRVDIEKQPKIAEEYNVFAVPITYFLSSEGEKLRLIPGYISKDRLLKILKNV